MSKITLHHGDCLEVLRGMPDNSVDACVTDPPYGLGKEPDALAMLRDWMETGHHAHTSKSGMMGRVWDAFVPQPALWCEVLRVLKPGGHVVAFAGSRTYDLMALGLRIAGFEIRDMAAWLHGQGMAKSLNISKAIDAAAGAERNILRYVRSDPKRLPGNGVSGLLQTGGYAGEYSGQRAPIYETSPATDAARQWDGWYSGLKPAIEPAVLARKPLEGTIAGNVLKWGTGGLNVDGCRIGTGEDKISGGCAGSSRLLEGGITERAAVDYTKGRFPANVLHDGSAEVLSCLPDAPGQQGRARTDGAAQGNSVYGALKHVTNMPQPRGDSGSAARFWFNSSDEMPSRIMYHPKANKKDRAGSKHVTVKPVNLMRWLCRLITPPGGTILDPFAGSGTTGEAAFEEGFDCILIEREAEYFADIQRRMEGIGAIAPASSPDLFGDIPTLEDLLGDIPA